MKSLLLDLQPQDYPLDGYRKKQLLSWVFEQAAPDFESMTNLPLKLRAELAEQYELNPYQKVDAFVSTDGSVKYLFTLHDGRQMEAVFIPY